MSIRSRTENQKEERDRIFAEEQKYTKEHFEGNLKLMEDLGISDGIGFKWRLRVHDDGKLHIERARPGKSGLAANRAKGEDLGWFWTDIATLSGYTIKSRSKDGEGFE